MSECARVSEIDGNHLEGYVLFNEVRVELELLSEKVAGLVISLIEVGVNGIASVEIGWKDVLNVFVCLFSIRVSGEVLNG